jgi:methylglutaconyl-CoA hydratase
MLKVETADAIGTLTLDRPALHNAFNDELIAKITKAIEDLGRNPGIRVIVFRANGPSFSAGGDLNWMKRAATYTADENLRDARAGAHMFLQVSRCPKPVIARVQGRALGGGSGLVACCDMAVAVESAEFGFPEVKIGLLPGIISPFVIARIGIANAREYFLTGERFSAMRAREIGLIQRIAADEPAMDAIIDRWIAELWTSSPSAVAAAKKLISDVGNRPDESVMDVAAEAIANARVSPEGRAGVEAFLSRTKAPWLPR